MFPITRVCFSDRKDSYKEEFTAPEYWFSILQLLILYNFAEYLATLLALLQRLSYLVEFGGSISDNSHRETKEKYYQTLSHSFT